MLKKIHSKFISYSILIRLIITTLLFLVFMIVTQNLQLFPGAMLFVFEDTERDPSDLPENVESIFITTKDGESLELWKLPASSSDKIALIFHGNGMDVENFFPYQKYFQSIGITSYGFDYRGYGKSTGWPTEFGLYLDSDAVTEFILEKENINPKQLILVGISIGTGPAAYSAEKLQAGSLILFSPFTSLKAVVKSQTLIGFLHPFLVYKFPVMDHINKLNDTCLIVIHGQKDNIIPFEQGKEIYENYPYQEKAFFIGSEQAGHNNILFLTKDKLSKQILKCL